MRKSSLYYDCGCGMGFELLGGTVRLGTSLNLCSKHAKNFEENIFEDD